MITGATRFNLYLASVVVVALMAGCRTAGDKKDKELATLRVHLQVIPESMDFSSTVPIGRKEPVMVTVDKAPFLTETEVAEAKVVDVPGGFDLQIKFNRRGTWLLESYTTTNPGKHFAVFSSFRDPKGKKQSRWLGAPIQWRRISSGIFSFVPDATREEAERIAVELNNVARKNKEASKW
jgi:preprotein translocase subunit SecD